MARNWLQLLELSKLDRLYIGSQLLKVLLLVMLGGSFLLRSRKEQSTDLELALLRVVYSSSLNKKKKAVT